MKHPLISLSAVLLAGVTLSATASAWTKIKNDHNHLVFVSHAFSSVSGFLCGWSDGCSGSDLADWRVEGWWALAAGGEDQIVHSQDYGNALHDIFAECDSGHVWSGGGHAFRAPLTAFSKCGSNVSTSPPPTDSRLFRNIRNSRCCGGSCPSNGTITLE